MTSGPTSCDDASPASQPPGREGASLQPPTQNPAGAHRAQSLRGVREAGERGRAGARGRNNDPRGARAQPRALVQRALRGDREGALRRRPGATAGAAQRDAGHNAGSALWPWRRRAQSRHRRRRASDEQRARCRADRAPPTVSCVRRSYATHVRACVRRRASSGVCASSDVASPARLRQSRHRRHRAQSRHRRRQRADTGDAERATRRERGADST